MEGASSKDFVQITKFMGGVDVCVNYLPYIVMWFVSSTDTHLRRASRWYRDRHRAFV